MNEFTDAIKERMSNSFSGPYALFFIVLNWRIMVFIFTGEDSAQIRIDNITSQLTKDGWFTYLNPLIATISYILIVPRIVSFIDLYNARVNAVNQTRIEKIDREYNRSWEYKFSLVNGISNRIMLQTNSMLSNRSFDPNTLKVIHRCVNALVEADKKDIHQHFGELREDNLV